jgi:hypothetical protein
MPNSGVSNDRAIYLPEGWQISYTSGNENDLTALKSDDFYFDRFFGSLPSPDTQQPSSNTQTYWVRQNWGTSTITLYQEMLLPEGEYKLDVDVWKSGLGGDAYVNVVTQDGTTVSMPSLENKEQWQHATLNFFSNGSASTTVQLQAMHNYNGTEKIIGFDNVSLTLLSPDEIREIRQSAGSDMRYDLQGRRVNTTAKGVQIVGGRKVIK